MRRNLIGVFCEGFYTCILFRRKALRKDVVIFATFMPRVDVCVTFRLTSVEEHFSMPGVSIGLFAWAGAHFCGRDTL